MKCGDSDIFCRISMMIVPSCPLSHFLLPYPAYLCDEFLVSPNGLYIYEWFHMLCRNTRTQWPIVPGGDEFCCENRSRYKFSLNPDLYSEKWQGQEIFLYPTLSRLALVHTQLPIQLVMGALSPGVKWPSHETYDSPPSSAKVKNVGATPPLPHMPSWHSA
jgi:hypothetical protein